MKIKINYTVDVSDDFRRALAHRMGILPRLPTRDELKGWYRNNADSIDPDVFDEYERHLRANESSV